MLRREFLAASAAGFFFPEGDGPVAREPEAVPISQLNRFGDEKCKIPKGLIYQLPKSPTRRIAWTVDDGTSSTSLRQYLDFVEKHDLQLTFFITSAYSSWKKNRRQLRELIASGNLQLANHTHSHPSLTRISSSSIQQELRRCHRFIQDTFEVNPKPYYRPPYGRIDKRVIAAAKDVGYRVPVMWNGSLGDSLTQRRQLILRMGDRWIQNRTILLDHVNDPTPNYVFKNLNYLLKKRKLQTVTLDDVFES